MRDLQRVFRSRRRRRGAVESLIRQSGRRKGDCYGSSRFDGQLEVKDVSGAISAAKLGVNGLEGFQLRGASVVVIGRRIHLVCPAEAFPSEMRGPRGMEVAYVCEKSDTSCVCSIKAN